MRLQTSYNIGVSASQPPEFDRYAPHYDELLADPVCGLFAKSSDYFHRRKWLLIQAFFRRQNVTTQPLHWLDVGCGRGELLRLGKGAFAAVSGCDPSQQMLEAAGEIRVIHQQDPLRLPFADDSFDFVSAVCVYHHVPPPERPVLTAEVARVLRPGGWFTIIEHNSYNPVARLIVSRTPVDANAILLTASESRLLQGQAGLTPISEEYFLYLPEFLFKRMGRVENLLRRIPLGGQYAAFARKPQR